MVSVSEQHHRRPVRILGNVGTNTRIDRLLLSGLSTDKFLQCFMYSASSDQVNSPEPGVSFQI